MLTVLEREMSSSSVELAKPPAAWPGLGVRAKVRVRVSGQWSVGRVRVRVRARVRVGVRARVRVGVRARVRVRGASRRLARAPGLCRACVGGAALAVVAAALALQPRLVRVGVGVGVGVGVRVRVRVRVG